MKASPVASLLLKPEHANPIQYSTNLLLNMGCVKMYTVGLLLLKSDLSLPQWIRSRKLTQTLMKIEVKNMRKALLSQISVASHSGSSLQE